MTIGNRIVRVLISRHGEEINGLLVSGRVSGCKNPSWPKELRIALVPTSLDGSDIGGATHDRRGADGVEDSILDCESRNFEMS